MRIIFKALVVAVLAVGLSSYAGYLMTGESFLSKWRTPAWLSKLPGDLSKSGKEALQTVDAPIQDRKEKIYKWKDATGTWQYTQLPPPPGTEVEVVEVDADRNVIAAIATTIK
jgi:hypothetical protein